MIDIIYYNIIDHLFLFIKIKSNGRYNFGYSSTNNKIYFVADEYRILDLWQYMLIITLSIIYIYMI